MALLRWFRRRNIHPKLNADQLQARNSQSRVSNLLSLHIPPLWSSDSSGEHCAKVERTRTGTVRYQLQNSASMCSGLMEAIASHVRVKAFISFDSTDRMILCSSSSTGLYCRGVRSLGAFCSRVRIDFGGPFRGVLLPSGLHRCSDPLLRLPLTLQCSQ